MKIENVKAEHVKKALAKLGKTDKAIFTSLHEMKIKGRKNVCPLMRYLDVTLEVPRTKKVGIEVDEQAVYVWNGNYDKREDRDFIVSGENPPKPQVKVKLNSAQKAFVSVVDGSFSDSDVSEEMIESVIGSWNV